MSNYDFGDTFINNNQAFIVIAEEGKRNSKFYYLQTRTGKLLTRSQNELDDLVDRLGYKCHQGLCNPKFIYAKDINIGDMIIGRDMKHRHDNKRRIGVVIGKKRRRSNHYFLDLKSDTEIRIMWSDNGHIQPVLFEHELCYNLNKRSCNNEFSRYHWKHIPAVK
jgi:hypothetical protein